MRILKKWLFVGFTVSLLMLSLSFSASALDSPINYIYTKDDVNSVPPSKTLSQYNLQNYQDVVLFTSNTGGYGYIWEIYLPRLSGVTWSFGVDTSNKVWLFYTNSSSSQIKTTALGTAYYYVYSEVGELVASGTLWNNDGPYGSGISSKNYIRANTVGSDKPLRTWTNLQYYQSGYISNNVTSWFMPLVNEGTLWAPDQSTSFTLTNPALLTFTLNDKTYDENGEEVGGGNGSTGCQCIDYSTFLQTIITNQGSQLDRLNTIISILQNYDNQDVVDAVESVKDSVDSVNDNLTPNESITVPSYEEPSVEFELPTNTSDAFANTVQQNNNALEWIYEKIDDLTSNQKVRAISISIMSMFVIALVINKQWGV